MVEKLKPGRPKSNKPTRNRSITIRLTESELEQLQKICYRDRVSYVDILLKGLEFWSQK